MTERIIDIGESPARLRIRNGLLAIGIEGDEHLVPVDHIAALVLSNPRINCTQAVLARLASANAAVIVCDERRSPCGMLLPLSAHATQCERFIRQGSANAGKRKNGWKQVVIRKVRNQARALELLTGRDHGLGDMARLVRSGDPDNVEARAARKYWPRIMGQGFTRDPDGPPPNGLLNYGYAILRSLTARSICASGLHPGLGLHHHNRYDPFPLANDLMEPFRPLVDYEVSRLVKGGQGPAEVDKGTKAVLLEAFTHRYGEARRGSTLFSLVSRAAGSLAAYYEGRKKKLDLPELWP